MGLRKIKIFVNSACINLGVFTNANIVIIRNTEHVVFIFAILIKLFKNPF
jgi:hypothetical protein